MAAHFDPYAEWLGISAEEQPPNYYLLLGVSLFETDTQQIETAARDRLEQLRAYQLSNKKEDAKKLIDEIVKARKCLRNPEKKALYDKQLSAELDVPLPAQQEEDQQEEVTHSSSTEESPSDEPNRVESETTETEAFVQELTSPTAVAEDDRATQQGEGITEGDATPPPLSGKAVLYLAAGGAVVVCVLLLGYFLLTYETPTGKITALLAQAEEASVAGDHARARVLCTDALKIEGAYNIRDVDKLLARLDSAAMARNDANATKHDAVKPKDEPQPLQPPAQPPAPVKQDPLTVATQRFGNAQSTGATGGTPHFTPHTISTAAKGAWSVYAADVDGDGDTDVLSASSGDNKIAWYENMGAGRFTPHTISTAAKGARSVYAADLDGDGDTDVLSASSGDSKIAWYENTGAGRFTPHTISTTAKYASSVYAADVDGDGDTDVVSASSGDNKIAWYENMGGGRFTPHTISTAAKGAWSVYAADVDGDGDTDVLSASSGDNKIAWYENMGRGRFTPHTISTSAKYARSVYAADVDGDGDTDVLSASWNDNKIAWYENTGAGRFTPHTISNDAKYASGVYVADVDGDGDTDVLSTSGGDNKIAWYENMGRGRFTPHTISTSAKYARSVYAADVDGDGDTDVLSASSGDNKIAWYDVGGQPVSPGEVATNDDQADESSRALTENFPVYATLAAPPQKLDAVTAAHSDEIGHWEYIVDVHAQKAKHLRRVHLLFDDAAAMTNQLASPLDDGSGAGTHTQKWDQSAAHQFSAPIYKQYFGSTASGGTWIVGDDYQLIGKGLINSWHSIAEYASIPHLIRNLPYFKVGAQIDPNRDGVIDGYWWRTNITTGQNVNGLLLTLRIVHPHPPAVNGFQFEANGMGKTGKFKTTWHTLTGPARPPGASPLVVQTEPARSAPARSESARGRPSASAQQPPTFAPHTITTDAKSAVGVATGDLDGDGDTDVLSASSGDHKIAWHENDGAGHFTSRTITTDAQWANSVTTADLDGDGDMDVLSASAGNNTIAWHENTGRGRFIAHTISDDAKAANSVSVADLDGDGDIDVLSASANDDKIAWYENIGVGQEIELASGGGTVKTSSALAFVSHTIATDAKAAESVAAADLDGDGDIDVLSASAEDKKIAWYQNDGRGHFTTRRTITTDAQWAQSVSVADLDGDGDADVLSASASDNKIAWYQNDGSGRFTPQTITTDAMEAYEVSASDLDGDGDVDVLSASGADSKIAWYENDGSGVFTPQTITTDAKGAHSVAAADLDGDGDIDVLSASFIDNKIAWYENMGGRQPAVALQPERRTTPAPTADEPNKKFTTASATTYLENLGLTRTTKGWEWNAAIKLQNNKANIESVVNNRRKVREVAGKYKNAINRANKIEKFLKDKLTLAGASSTSRRKILSGENEIASFTYKWVKKLSRAELNKIDVMQDKLLDYRKEVEKHHAKLKEMKDFCNQAISAVESNWRQLKIDRRSLFSQARVLNEALKQAGGQLVKSGLQEPEIDHLLAEARELSVRIDSALAIS